MTSFLISTPDLKGVARVVSASPVARFVGIGVISTLAHAILYLLLSGPLGAGAGNAVALAITAVANTAANRRITFGVRGRGDVMRHHARGLVVFGVAVSMTSGALALLYALDPRPARSMQLAVLVAANLTATVMRFVAMKTWVFRRQRRSPRHADRPALDRADKERQPGGHGGRNTASVGAEK